MTTTIGIIIGIGINCLFFAFIFAFILNLFAKRVAENVVKLTTQKDQHIHDQEDVLLLYEKRSRDLVAKYGARGKTIHKLERKIAKRNRKSARQHKTLSVYSTAKYMGDLKYSDKATYMAALEVHRARYDARRIAKLEQAQIDLEEQIAAEAVEQQTAVA